MRFCPKAASGITRAPPTSTDPFASRRSVTPISRGHANALGFQHPGAFCFWRSQEETHTIKTRLHRAPEASGLCWSEAGKPAKAQGCAVPGCFGTGGKRMQSHTDWRFRRGANAEHRRTIHSGTGLHARPVRAALPWRMPGIWRRCSTKRRWLSWVEQQRRLSVAGSTPARLTWIAQTVRASVSDTECCGFDSRSKQRPVTSLHTGASPHQETPRA